MKDDRFLRDLFAAASREDSGDAPPFALGVNRAISPGERPRPRFRPGRAAFAAIVIVLAITLAYLRNPGPSPAPATLTEQLLSQTRWESPTDFLLETPGAELLHSTPKIGEPSPFEDGSPEPKKGTRT